ncbi:DUF2255 family protein [Cellulomonas sp. PhB143]|uniref:DUF2255 family protein n=1 Tax=Cellulomonas sp. PhB143 TaxID=2485186 RepID=UPI000F4AB97C|nr:DUF2255 family protein [Cellulomonas sp. PhB143]ROS75456.1 hypothetical protein EDF32_1866 [Cellulomonas sp. PhB143]
MPTWNTDDLAAIDGVDEIHVAAHQDDGTLAASRTIWSVVVDGVLYVRSVRGVSGAWYQDVRRTGTGRLDAGDVQADVTFGRDDEHDPAIDAAYHAKYGDGPHVLAITNPEATATTLRVEPA